jgi:hypothetical protein
MRKNPSSDTAARRTPKGTKASGKRTRQSSRTKQEPTIPASTIDWSAGKPTRYIRVTDVLRPEEDHREIEHDLRKQATQSALNPMAFRTPLLNTIFTGKPIVRLRRMSLRPIG